MQEEYFQDKYPGYSREKFNWAKADDLNPDDKERLEKYRETVRRWREVTSRPRIGVGAVQAVLAEFKEIREVFRISQFMYEMGGGRTKHAELEKAYAKTKAGQLELAEDETSFFNDAFDVRAERLRKAEQQKDNAPEEYDAALASFNELLKDLNEGDLRKYSDAILSGRMSKSHLSSLPPLDVKLDIKPNREQE